MGIVKFITAHGGETTHEVDVTDLAPFLGGPVVWKGHVDTWVTPAWRMDFEVEVRRMPMRASPRGDMRSSSSRR